VVPLAAVAALVAGSASGWQKARKLPVDAYIKSAKIAIISGDLDRYPEAIAMLDSLFMNYGPHAEGLHWMGQIMVDYIEKSPSPEEKKPYVEKMVAYTDSLHMCCESKDVKKKFQKHCDEYIKQADSIRVKYWREFYNAGVEQLSNMTELEQEVNKAEDSTTRSYFENSLTANLDSCVGNMELAIALDPNNHQTYIAIGSAYEKVGQHDKALEWQQIGLERAPDSVKATMALSIGYTYINMDKYCDAIPYLRTYLADSTRDTTWMYNLSICYNNCGQYDSAVAIYREMLAVDSNQARVLSGIGRHFNDIGRRAVDSARFYQEQGNEAKEKEWLAQKDLAFDSSHAYFKRAFRIDPNDEFVADMYALVSALKGKFADAAEGYTRLTELDPSNPDYWTYLGDVRLSQGQLEDAIAAYEKAVELKPGATGVWQNLVDLYHDQGMSEKEAAAKKKLEALK